MKVYILIFLAGLCLGMLINELLILLNRRAGVLRIDQTSSATDIYRLEIDNLDTIPHKKYIVLKIDSNADLSQK